MGHVGPSLRCNSIALNGSTNSRFVSVMGALEPVCLLSEPFHGLQSSLGTADLSHTVTTELLGSYGAVLLLQRCWMAQATSMLKGLTTGAFTGNDC